MPTARRPARSAHAAHDAASAPVPAQAATVSLRPFDRSLPMALLRAREAVMARFRPMLRAHDLSEQQWRVLRALAAAGALRPSELSTATLLSQPSLSRLLPALEARRLIRRDPDPRDQRAARIALCAAGARLIDRIAPASEAIYAAIAEAIGDRSLETLYALLATVPDRLAAEPDTRGTRAGQSAS